MPDTRIIRLHEINALVQGNVNDARRTFTDSHRGWKEDPLTGVYRTYQRYNDEDETLPAQSKHVQIRVDKVIDMVTGAVGRVLDLELAQDRGNTEAKADIVVDGQTVLADVPVTYLLRLDKWLTDVRTFIANLPVLDPGEVWHYDESRDCWVSEPVDTARTVKVNKVLTKWAPPSEKYSQPAQTEVVTEDVRVGTWTTVKLSGAVPAPVKRLYAEKLTKLVDAVKVAREQANSIEIPEVPAAGKAIFDYLFR